MPPHGPTTMSNIVVFLGQSKFSLFLGPNKRKPSGHSLVQAEGPVWGSAVVNTLYWLCVGVPAHDPTERLSISTSS